MINNDYISSDYKVLDSQLSVAEAKHYFKEIPFTHFPIVDKGILIGMLAQEDIIHFNNDNKLLVDLQYLFKFYKTEVSANCIDLISLFAQHDTDIIPVIDNENRYLGYFELDEILQLLYNAPFFSTNSTTLIIEKDNNSYSLSEIAQIVASNDIELLGLYISDNYNDKTQITLRVNTDNVNEVIQSLRRYDYSVLTKNKDDLLMEQYKDRTAYLQKYMSI